MQNAAGSVWRLTLSTVLKPSEHWKQLHTVNQQILAAIKFGVSQTKNDLAAIQFGMSPSSFLLILTFPHLLRQIYLWQTTTRQPTRRPYFYLSMNILGYKCYFAFTTKSYSLQSILLGWIKRVGPMLTHLYIYPHRSLRRIKVYVITRLKLNLLFCVAWCLIWRFASFKKVWSYKTLNVHTEIRCH